MRVPFACLGAALAHALFASSFANAWTSLPQIPNAALNGFPINGNESQLVNYVTAGYDPSKVKRAVISIPGLARDAWSYFNWTDTALQTAVAQNGSVVSNDDVVTFVPMFFNTDDKGAFPWDNETRQATSNELVWKGNQWADGSDSYYPEGATKVSTFEAIDQVIAFFADQSKFPNMKTIVVAGHSMGGQFVQRYAAVGRVPSGGLPVLFYVANPSSYAYFTADRPNATCPGYNDWKYGYDNYNITYGATLVTSNYQALVSRYMSRRLMYAYGLSDTAVGDPRCEAAAQGAYHLERGRNWIAALGRMPGGFPSQTQSVDYIPGIAHDPLGMFSSHMGLYRLFYENINGGLTQSGVGNSDPLSKDEANEARDFTPSGSSEAVADAKRMVKLHHHSHQHHHHHHHSGKGHHW